MRYKIMDYYIGSDRNNVALSHEHHVGVTRKVHLELSFGKNKLKTTQYLYFLRKLSINLFKNVCYYCSLTLWPQWLTTLQNLSTIWQPVPPFKRQPVYSPLSLYHKHSHSLHLFTTLHTSNECLVPPTSTYSSWCFAWRTPFYISIQCSL